MACGKPPDPGQMSQPTPLRQPLLDPVRICMRDVQSAVKFEAPGPELDRHLKRVRNAVTRAERAGLAEFQLNKLKQQLQNLEQMATNKLRSLVRGPSSTNLPATNPPSDSEIESRFSASAAERIAPKIRTALTDPNHWRHQETKDQLTRVVMGNEAIGSDYKNQLCKDIVEVIRATPNALGLVKEATIRGQRNSIATKGKLGTGMGYAYEIMGRAELQRTVSPATNTGGLPLHIDISRDKVDHGIPLQASYLDPERRLFQSRKSIEADILIWKPDGREVAVDFKHAKGGGGFSDKGGKKNTLAGKSDLATQLVGVVNALKSGEISEFHFATNGHFSSGFKEAVERANENLPRGCSPISLHEHVMAAGLQ